MKIGMRILEDAEVCPQCGSEDIGRRHIEQSYVGETYWLECNECEYQWGHC